TVPKPRIESDAVKYGWQCRSAGGPWYARAPKRQSLQAAFQVDKKGLGIKGSNAYFNLQSGYRLSYKDGNNTDTLSGLNETRVIDGVETSIEEREIKTGALVELTLEL